MSCYVVPNEKYSALYNTLESIKAPSDTLASHELHHALNTCITYIKDQKIYAKSKNPLFAWIADLVVLNENAYNERYGLQEPLDGFTLDQKAAPLEPMHLYKLLRCIDYQCDEQYALYQSSVAREVLCNILNCLAHYLVKETIDYENAPWG